MAISSVRHGNTTTAAVSAHPPAPEPAYRRRWRRLSVVVAKDSDTAHIDKV